MLTAPANADLRRTILPTVVPVLSRIGSTCSSAGTATGVRTGAWVLPSKAASSSTGGSATSHSNASCQLSTDVPSTTSSSTGR